MSRKRQAALVGALVLLPATAVAQLLGGQEFQVNTYTTGRQQNPAVAADDPGNFVVVWRSQGQAGAYLEGVFGQRYDSTGAPVGGEFQVNTYTTINQVYGPAVAVDGAGNFVVVWSNSGQDGDYHGVFGQRYDGAGTPVGGEFQVNTYTTSSQKDPAAAADGAGNFLVVWQSFGQDGSQFGIFGQRYDSTGTAVGGEFIVNTYTTAYQNSPAVAADGTGNFVVVWSSAGQDGSLQGVFGQRYDSSATPLGGEFQVNTYTTNSQRDPAIAVDGTGNFVVAWSSYGQDGARDGVFGQRYDSSGAPLGGEFQVNIYTYAPQRGPAVAVEGAGSFAVGEISFGQYGFRSLNDIIGRRYDSSGSPLSGEFRVNTYTPDSQSQPAVAADGAGNFVVVWASYGQDGSHYGIFGKRYSSAASLSGKKLLVKDSPDVTSRRIVLRSRDPILSTSMGVGVSPVLDGAFLQIYNNNGSGESACFSLPASGWVTKGDAAQPTYKYTDSEFVNGPCKAAIVKPGRLLKVICRATVQPIPYSLDEPAQMSIGVDFESGTAKYCAVFGGTILSDSSADRVFKAKNAPAPAVCPTPPAACP